MHAAMWCWTPLPFSLHDFLCEHNDFGAVSHVGRTVVLRKMNMLKGSDNIFILHSYIFSRNITENKK